MPKPSSQNFTVSIKTIPGLDYYMKRIEEIEQKQATADTSY